MNIYLVRHGETDWNRKFFFQGHTDIPLNSAGRKQAKQIASEFRGRKFGAIITSDLKRAAETAAIIKKAAGLTCPVIKDMALRERDYGSLEGKAYDMHKHRKKDFDGEKDGKFFARVNRAFNSIVRKYSKKDKDIIIVSHGGVVRQMAAYVAGVRDYKRFRIYNASVSEVFYRREDRAMFLILLNSVAHLPRKERNKIQYHIKGV